MKDRQRVASPTAFNNAVISRPSGVDKKLAEIEEKAGLIFSPKPVSRCDPNQYYYFPGRGVVKCTLKGPMEFAGIPMNNVAVLEKLFSVPPTREYIHAGNINKSRVRRLIDKKLCEIIPQLIEEQRTSIDFSGLNPIAKSVLVQEILKTSNPVVLVNLIGKIFGKGRTITPDGLSFRAAGDEALRLLAAEYAHVKGLDFKNVLESFTVLSGKPAGHDLNRHDFTMKSLAVRAPSVK